MKTTIFGLLAMSVLASAASAQVSQVTYASLTGTQTVTFDDIAGGPGSGTNYDNVFFSNGVGFAERFAGQTLTTSGNFDTLSASASGPLALQTGAAGQNLNIFLYNNTNVLTGLGPLGFPDSDAIGEGAFAALFSSDQSQFGFQLVGGNAGSATVSVFRGDGSLIQSLTLSGLADAFYGFQRDGGINDIRGISIFNNDLAGIGFDNLRFDVPSVGGDVPEPASWMMMIGGFGLAGAAMRRQRTTIRFA